MNGVSDAAKYRFLDAHRECQRHFHHLFNAMRDLAARSPFHAETLERLSDEDVRSFDQFVFRFTKLQDAMGSRLFPAVLGLIGEPYEEWTMIDRLNRLERLGFLQEARAWQRMREACNRLAHEYPDDPEVRAEVLNRAWMAIFELHRLYNGLLKRLSGLSVTEPGGLQLVGIPGELE